MYIRYGHVRTRNRRCRSLSNCNTANNRSVSVNVQLTISATSSVCFHRRRLSLTPRNANVTGTEVKIRDGRSAGKGKGGKDDEQRHPNALQGEEFGHRRPGNLQHLILQGPQQESGHDDRSEGQYGGLRTENAEDVRRPAPPTLSMAMVFERLTNVEIEIST